MTTATMERVDPSTRQERLNQAIRAEMTRGARIESQTGDTAVLVRGNRVNHVLHLILTLVTLGIWVFVWLILSASGGEKRRLVTADEYGNVSTQDVKAGPPIALIVLGVVVALWVIGFIASR